MLVSRNAEIWIGAPAPIRIIQTSQHMGLKIVPLDFERPRMARRGMVASTLDLFTGE